MGRYKALGGKPYKPDYISRKMFDVYQDRLDRRVARIKEDYRSDIVAVLARVQNLETLWDQLFPIEQEQKRGIHDASSGEMLSFEERRARDRRSKPA